MRKILFFCSLFLSTILSAQAPQGINYQAVYRNAAGLVKNTDIVVECRVRQGSATGTTLYSENHNVKTNDAGLFTLVIGKGNDPIGIFKDIDWGSGDKWCDIKIGGTLIGAFQFQSVPYALRAADGVPVGTIQAFAGTKIPIGYLACDNTEYLQTDYPNLFAVLGNTWGSASLGKFRVPDLRGIFLRGLDGTAGNDPDNTTRLALVAGGNIGNKVGSYQNDDFKSHTHQAGPEQKFGYDALGSNGDWRVNSPNKGTSTATGGTETRPKNAYVLYIIKY